MIFCIFPPPVMACRRFLLQMHVTKLHHTYVCLMIVIEAGHPQLTHHNLHSHWQKKSKRRCSYKLAGNHEHDYIWVACDVFYNVKITNNSNPQDKRVAMLMLVVLHLAVASTNVYHYLPPPTEPEL